jgi:Flp pilus assembly protein CpaB
MIKEGGKKIGSPRPLFFPSVAGLITFVTLAVYATGFNAHTGLDKKKTTLGVAAPAKSAVVPNPVDKGYRAYAITVEADNPAISIINASDKIDVIVSFPANADDPARTDTVVAGARVISVDAKNRSAVLSVTPADAEKLAFSQTNGELRIALCPAGPDTAIAGQGATYDSL